MTTTTTTPDGHRIYRTTSAKAPVTGRHVDALETLGLNHEDAGYQDAIADYDHVQGELPRCADELAAWIAGVETYDAYRQQYPMTYPVSAMPTKATAPMPAVTQPAIAASVPTPTVTQYELAKHDRVTKAMELLGSVIATVRESEAVLRTADCLPTLLKQVGDCREDVCSTYNAVLAYQRQLAGCMQRAAKSVSETKSRDQQLAAKPAPKANTNAVLNAPKPQAEASSKPVVVTMAAQTATVPVATPVATPVAPKPVVQTPVATVPVTNGGVAMATSAIEAGTLGAMRTAITALGIAANATQRSGTGQMSKLLRAYVAEQTSAKPTIEPATGTGETVPTGFTFAELRKMCKQAGIKAVGNHAKLVELLAAHKATYNVTPNVERGQKLALVGKLTETPARITEDAERKSLLSQLGTLDIATLRELVAAYATAAVKAAA